MARRKSSEVIFSGDKVDPRFQGKVTRPETAPVKSSGSDSRQRKIPKVIDARTKRGDDKKRGAADKMAAAENGLGDLERELGMLLTATPGGKDAASPRGKIPDADMPKMVPIEARKKKEVDTNWKEIEGGSLRSDTDWETKEPGPPADISRPAPPQPKEPPADGVSPKPATPAVAPKDSAPAKSTPKPATASKAAPASSPKAQSEALAKTVVNSMVDRMKSQAVKNGGSLSVADIDAMRGEFNQQTRALTHAFELSFEAYVKARERAEWDQKRDFPFDRMIVKKFSHFFNENKQGRFDTVSRRMLPGFFMAIGMMMGPEVVDEYQERCRMILERLRGDTDGEFDWDTAYKSPETTSVVMDALVSVAAHFGDFEKRREWFIGLVNGHLTPVDDQNREEAGWEMLPAGFDRFLDALLSDLRTALATDADKERLAKRYGGDGIRVAIEVLAKIAA